MRVLLVDIDSLRPDRLSCYGYQRPTSPNIDRLAAEGVRFDNCFVSDTPCAPSRAGFITGMQGTRNGVLAHSGPGFQLHVDVRLRSIARILHSKGIHTATVSSFADRHTAWWFLAGWRDAITHTLKVGNEDAHEVNEAAIRWLETNGARDDWLLHVQYWDPHTYYTAPAEWVDRFRDQPMPDCPTRDEFETHLELATPHSPRFLDYLPRDTYLSPYFDTDRLFTWEDFQTWTAAYDGAIAYADHHIGQLLDLLDGMGVLEDTAVVVTSDHGENQGEQGVYGEHCGVYDATQRVPLIIRAPGRIAPGGVGTDLINHLDIVPTLAELFGADGHPDWDGRSLFDLLEARGEPWRDHVITTHGLWSAQRGVRTSDWAFVRTYHPGMFLHFGPVELYDARSDPAQRSNVAGDHPDVVGELSALLDEWRGAVRSAPGGAPVDPLEHVMRSPYLFSVQMWIERLRAEGFGEAADRTAALAG